MSDVRSGDHVRVSRGEFSPIFGFTHRDPTAAAFFVRIITESGDSVSMTAGHYLRVNGDLSSANKVKVGDLLETARGTLTSVIRIDHEIGFGLYNPQTLDGEIVIDGILVSTYTTAIAPIAAHVWLAPSRLLYRHFGIRSTVLEIAERQELARLLPLGYWVFSLSPSILERFHIHWY